MRVGRKVERPSFDVGGPLGLEVLEVLVGSGSGDGDSDGDDGDGVGEADGVGERESD